MPITSAKPQARTRNFGEMPSDKDGELEKFMGQLTALQNDYRADFLRLHQLIDMLAKMKLRISKQIEGFWRIETVLTFE